MVTRRQHQILQVVTGRPKLRITLHQYYRVTVRRGKVNGATPRRGIGVGAHPPVFSR